MKKKKKSTKILLKSKTDRLKKEIQIRKHTFGGRGSSGGGSDVGIGLGRHRRRLEVTGGGGSRRRPGCQRGRRGDQVSGVEHGVGGVIGRVVLLIAGAGLGLGHLALLDLIGNGGVLHDFKLEVTTTDLLALVEAKDLGF